MTAQQKRSAERRIQNELALSKDALKAFRHFKANAGLADDSQVILALIQQAEPENLFDDTTAQDFFRGSEQPEFKPLTERELVRRAAQLLGVPLPQLIRSGAILLAKREILTRTNQPADTEAPDNLRSGVAGSADHRIEQAFQTLSQAGKPLSPARLAKLSRTNFFSAQRWLQLHHPELLLQQPAVSTSSDHSSPAAQDTPKPPATSAKSPQEPAKPSPALSTSPKAKKRAKRLRNPETEP